MKTYFYSLPVIYHDSEQVPEGVELAVQKMKEGERNIITIQPAFGYGDKEFKGPLVVVPPNSVLTYDLTLVSFLNVSLIDCLVPMLGSFFLIVLSSVDSGPIGFNSDLCQMTTDVVQAKDSWEMSNVEKISSAEVSKDKGNVAFKDGRLERAVRWYDKASVNRVKE